MPKIPCILTLLPDELLYSYLLRTSLQNGFANIQDFMNCYVFSTGENENRSSAILPYDIRDDLYRFFDSVSKAEQTQTLPFYRKTSLFHGFAPLCSAHRMSRHIGLLSKYRNPSKLLSSCDPLIRQLKFCPQCQANELELYGCFYYHRAHQMPEVTVCHEHGCALHIYEGKRGEEMKMPLMSSPLPFHPKSHEYAIFCKEFLETELECDLEAIAEALLKKLQELGYSSKNQLLSEQMKDYSVLMKDTPAQIIDSIQRNDRPHADSILTMLLYSFHDVNTLKEYLKPNIESRQPFSEAIINKYILLSPFREDIVELQCKECGDCFLSTPTRIFSGWGCPRCDSKVGDVTLFQNLFQASHAKNFELLSDFTTPHHPVRIRHLACGKEFDATVQKCLKNRLKCRCSYTLAEDTVREKIESLGEFELLTFIKSMEPIVLRHKDCGNIFHTWYHVFIKNPRCSVCQRLKNNRHLSSEEFDQLVSDLVDDEYTVVTPYEAAKKRILIRHNLCNSVQDYLPDSFLRGQRCKYCNSRVSGKDLMWQIFKESDGKYVVVRLDNQYAEILDTESNERITLQRKIVLQELRRPTQSKILPLENRKQDDPTKKGRSA